MMLSGSALSEISFENSIWKASASFVNLNGSMSISPSDEIAEEQMAKFGNINANINHEVVPPFLKSDTAISTNLYHRRIA